MIYQYTGQPGHGKTLHGIDKALEWVDAGREVYACNIREFQAAKAGMVEITPEQFCTWQDWAPDGSAFLIDECYEHKMLPKRAPGAALPVHVEQLAKHRHRGIDFIFIAQSPGKQMDVFVHDLIERHTHVRRRFGTMFVHLRIFDRFEPNPAKSHPLILQRVRLPKRPRGLYKSTQQDTTEKKIPWYYPAAVVVALFVLGMAGYSWMNVREQLGNGETPKSASVPGVNGAKATVAPGALGAGKQSLGTAAEYADLHTPRFPSKPWSAPLYDGRKPTSDPQLFCVVRGAGTDAQGEWQDGNCRCVTEQNTAYKIQVAECRRIVAEGPDYNPYLQRRDRASDRQLPPRGDAVTFAQGATVTAPGGVHADGYASAQSRYGQMRRDTVPAEPALESISF